MGKGDLRRTVRKKKKAARQRTIAELQKVNLKRRKIKINKEERGLPRRMTEEKIALQTVLIRANLIITVIIKDVVKNRIDFFNYQTVKRDFLFFSKAKKIY